MLESSIAAPQPPELMNSGSSDVSATLTWNELSDVQIDSYLIEYRVEIDQPEWRNVTLTPSTTSYNITGLSPGTTYEVRIFAISTNGVTSVAAEPITITTGGIVI